MIHSLQSDISSLRVCFIGNYFEVSLELRLVRYILQHNLYINELYVFRWPKLSIRLWTSGLSFWVWMCVYEMRVNELEDIRSVVPYSIVPHLHVRAQCLYYSLLLRAYLRDAGLLADSRIFEFFSECSVEHTLEHSLSQRQKIEFRGRRKCHFQNVNSGFNRPS